MTSSSSTSNSVEKDRYCHTECILYGTVFESYKENLRQRLHGLCDPEEVTFKEHNMIFKLSKVFINIHIEKKRFKNVF